LPAPITQYLNIPPENQEVLPVFGTFDSCIGMRDKTVPPETLILASNSPRRSDLLRQAGISFTAIPSTVDEDMLPVHPPETYVTTLAKLKADDVAHRYPANWVISADTVVLLSGDVLGKPLKEDEARRMLRRLSDRVHTVLTGYCLCCKEREKSVVRVSETQVHFRSVGEAEIDWYVGTKEPLDKAGGYGIQGLGAVLVKGIVGSYTNVVGLPLCEVVTDLMSEGAIRR
jgi:septum formation protein